VRIDRTGEAISIFMGRQMTRAEVAAKYGRDLGWVYQKTRARAKHRMPSHNIGGTTIFFEAELDRWAQSIKPPAQKRSYRKSEKWWDSQRRRAEQRERKGAASEKG
jgi:hypothetical protein